MRILLPIGLALLATLLWVRLRPHADTARASTRALGPTPTQVEPQLERSAPPELPTERPEDRVGVPLPPPQAKAPAPVDPVAAAALHEPYPEGPLLGRHRKLRELKKQLRSLQGNLLFQKLADGDFITVEKVESSTLRDSQGRPLPNAIRFMADEVHVAVLRHDEYPEICELFWQIQDLDKEIRALEESE